MQCGRSSGVGFPWRGLAWCRWHHTVSCSFRLLPSRQLFVSVPECCWAYSFFQVEQLGNSSKRSPTISPWHQPRINHKHPLGNNTTSAAPLHCMWACWCLKMKHSCPGDHHCTPLQPHHAPQSHPHSRICLASRPAFYNMSMYAVLSVDSNQRQLMNSQ